MEKVCLNSCIPNYYITGKTAIPSAAGNTISSPFPINSREPLNSDTVNFRNKKAINLEKLNNLFPNEELQKIYQEMNNEFGIDHVPEIEFVGEDDGIMAGGYTFSTNKITLSLSDLMESDTKIVGIKDGKRTVLTSPKNGLPLFINSKMAQVSAMILAKQGNLGFDKLIVEPVTADEHKNFIVQKISHELIHAQQHMIMRQTEGIGEKEIIKAWTHEKPTNMIDKAILGFKTKKQYETSYWSKIPETQQTISAESDLGKKSKEWLEAIRNYPKVDSPEYETNPIEVDAYSRSAKYVEDKYGKY